MLKPRNFGRLATARAAPQHPQPLPDRARIIRIHRPTTLPALLAHGAGPAARPGIPEPTDNRAPMIGITAAPGARMPAAARGGQRRRANPATEGKSSTQ